MTTPAPCPTGEEEPLLSQGQAADNGGGGWSWNCTEVGNAIVLEIQVGIRFTMGMRLKWGLRFGIEVTVAVGSVFKLGLRLKLILRSKSGWG